MILHRGQGAEAVSSLFEASGFVTARELHTAADGGLEPSPYDCWRALDRARSLAWLVDPQSDDDPLLDMEEFDHYAAPANGAVHLTVPGKLFFFPTPKDLPAGQDWDDCADSSGAVVRRFSARFYADLLHHLGASCVVCLGGGSAQSAAALAARGLHVEDLGLAADGSSLLRGLDRLLSLARAAPGAVAVYSGDGAVWPGYTGSLAAAFLISRLGFDEGSARAWPRLTSPWAAAAAGPAAAALVVDTPGPGPDR